MTKLTVRNSVFETNSSTMHSLILNRKHSHGYKNVKFPKPTDVDTITLMSREEWYNNDHKGIIEKFRSIATDCLIVHDWYPEESIKVLNKLCDLYNNKYNTNIKLDLSLLEHRTEYWPTHIGDGCAAEMIDIFSLSNKEILDAVNLNDKKRKRSLSLTQKMLLMKNRSYYYTDISVMHEVIYEDRGYNIRIDNFDELLELITNDKIVLWNGYN